MAKMKTYTEGVANNIESYQIKHLHSDWGNGEITVPAFQRNYEYNPSQKISVINSILMNLSLDTLTVVRPYESVEKILCDGYHRLRTIVDFLDDKFKYNSSLSNDTLRWFNKRQFVNTKDLNGKYFSEFPKLAKQRILEYKVSVCEITIKHPSVSKNRIIAFLMEQKNSCSAPVPPERMKLNRTFIVREGLIDTWEKFNSELSSKAGLNYKIPKAINSSIISETYASVLKFLNYDPMLIDQAVDKVIKKVKVFSTALDSGKSFSVLGGDEKLNCKTVSVRSIATFIKQSLLLNSVLVATHCSSDDSMFLYRIYKQMDDMSSRSSKRGLMEPYNVLYLFTLLFGMKNEFVLSRTTSIRNQYIGELNNWLDNNTKVKEAILRIKQSAPF